MRADVHLVRGDVVGGQWLGTVEIPAELSLRVVTEDRMVGVLKDELDARDQAISQLNAQLEEKSTQLKEKDKGMQELNIQIHRLKKQAGTSQETEIESSTEENNTKKAKFSFLK